MNTKLLVLTMALGALALSARSQTTTNFYADFDSAAPQDLKALGDNDARTAALDAGTAIGSWTNLANPNTTYVIAGNGAGNNALAFDDGGIIQTIDIAQGNFPATQMLSDTERVTVKFKWMKTDPGGAGGDNTYFDLFNDTGVMVAGLRWQDGTNIGGPIAHGEVNTGTWVDFSPVFDVDQDMSATSPYDAANMINVEIALWQNTVVYHIDTNQDGINELASTNTVIRNNVASFRLRAGSNLSNQQQGAWVDDIFVYTSAMTNEPPPATTNLNQVVNFAGNPTTNGYQVARSYSVSNDTQRSYNFDATTPFFDGPATNCMKIYGGWDGRIGDTNWVADTHWISGSNGQLVNSVQSSTSAATNQLMFLWDKADFLYGGSAKTWGFLNAATNVLTVNLFRNDGILRFVIRDGGSYYVSEKALSNVPGTFMLKGDEGVLWAAWDPTAKDGADFYNLPTNGFDTAVFSNVTAVGLVCQNNKRGINQNARFTINAIDKGFAAELVELAASSTLYDSWAAGYPTMTNGSPQVDFDNDGLINLYEYGLGGNPTNGFVDGEIPTFGTAAGMLEYIHAQRTDDASLSYYLELTGDLVFPGWTNAGYTVTGTNITVGTFDYVTNQIPTTDPKKFIRLIIE
jgi:hypothetical protein